MRIRLFVVLFVLAAFAAVNCVAADRPMIVKLADIGTPIEPLAVWPTDGTIRPMGVGGTAVRIHGPLWVGREGLNYQAVFAATGLPAYAAVYPRLFVPGNSEPIILQPYMIQQEMGNSVWFVEVLYQNFDAYQRGVARLEVGVATPAGFTVVYTEIRTRGDIDLSPIVQSAVYPNALNNFVVYGSFPAPRGAVIIPRVFVDAAEVVGRNGVGWDTNAIQFFQPVLNTWPGEHMLTVCYDSQCMGGKYTHLSNRPQQPPQPPGIGSVGPVQQ